MSNESLRILITNWILDDPGGTQLYVRDLAMALLARGHRPFVYSRIHGDISAQIKAAGIPVVDNLNEIDLAPDIIHGHHHIETLTALLRFPSTPGIFICHGPVPMQEAPPRFPRIVQYLAVSKAARDRLVARNDIPGDRVRIVSNFVDL